LRKSFGLLLLHSSEFWFSSLLFPLIVREGSFATPQQLAPTICVCLLFPLIVREGSFGTPQQLAPTICVWLKEETQNVHKEEENYR
jgi:hypothetical protein